MFSSIRPRIEQLYINKSHKGSWSESFKKPDHAIFFEVFCGQSNKMNFNIFFNIGKTPLAASR